MTQPPRKPSRPARTPTSRPRRVAGQAPGTARDETQDVDVDVDVEDEPPTEPTTEPVVEPVDVLDEPDQPDRSQPTRRRPLVALCVAIVLLLGIGAAEVVYLTSDHEPERAAVSAERPVQLPDLEVRRVVDQAGAAAKLILAASSKDYDTQVDKATATMTDPFAEKYRTAKADIKKEFIAQQTEVVIDISAQGVVSASDDEVVALLFLTQTTQKGTRGGVRPVQYRVTVTMVDTADGWLVSDLVAL